MAKPIENVLHFENLTSIAKGTLGLVKSIPESFMRVTGSQSGETGYYNKVEGPRSLARQCAYDAPARTRGKQGITKVPFTMIHNREAQPYKASELTLLQSETSSAQQKMGMETVARNTKDFAMQFANARASAIAVALANGIVYYDADGYLLSSSSGAAFSIDYGVPAGHKSQLDWDGNGDTLNANWSSAAGNIINDLENTKIAFEQAYGGELKYAFYGSNIPGYMLNNTGLKSYVAGNPQMSAQAVEQVLPNYAGLIWLPLKAFWIDEDGDIADAVGANTVVFCQEPDASWWEVREGSYPIPRSLDVASDAVAALSNMEEVFGMGSYASISVDPPSINQYMLDTFIPLLKAPKSVFMATVPTS